MAVVFTILRAMKSQASVPFTAIKRTRSASSTGRTTAHEIYPKLRLIARSRLRLGRDEVLDTTALVHESYIRFAESPNATIDGWTGFLHYAPRIMRNLVVDSIRRRNAQIHGGDIRQVELDSNIAPASAESAHALAIHDAIKQLKIIDTRLAQVVTMRFFEGMTEREIALALGLTERTVRRDWEKARLLLAQAVRV